MDKDDAKRSQIGTGSDSADGEQAPGAGEPTIEVPLSTAHSLRANIRKLVLRGRPGIARMETLVRME